MAQRRLCVIIGFCYDVHSDQHLVSASIDMFTVFNFFSTRGFMCKVISDVYCHPQPVIESMFSGHITDNIYSFLPYLPSGRDPLDTLEWISTKDITQLLNAIRGVDTTGVTKLVIYYTGHSERDGKIVAPDNNMIGSSYVRRKLLKKCDPNVEVMSIIDSCFVGNDGLPFVFEEDRFVLKDIDSCIEQLVIHFSSSLSNEVSESELTRSVFTSSFFRHLSNEVLSIESLIKLVQKDMNNRTKRKQTATCSCSFDISPNLYSWLLPSGVDVMLM